MRKSFQNRHGWVMFGVTLVLLLTFGWTVLAQRIDQLNDTNAFRVEVSNVRLVEQSGDVTLLKDPFYALDSVVFHVGFRNVGDYVLYEATVSNLGSDDVYLDDMAIQLQDSVWSPIKIEVTGVKTGSTKLPRFEENKVLIRFTYSDDASVDDPAFIPSMTSLLRFFYRSL